MVKVAPGGSGSSAGSEHPASGQAGPSDPFRRAATDFSTGGLRVCFSVSSPRANVATWGGQGAAGCRLGGRAAGGAARLVVAVCRQAIDHKQQTNKLPKCTLGTPGARTHAHTRRLHTRRGAGPLLPRAVHQGRAAVPHQRYVCMKAVRHAGVLGMLLTSHQPRGRSSSPSVHTHTVGAQLPHLQVWMATWTLASSPCSWAPVGRARR